ncbi:hypothetical protein K437DRAFT_253611 [Tilletiaria anomala UBC 951]|uniref:Uncharacterized protein n=1 Tax=Tilletiaria anomala (strain ATCC 24038 / CBS 436.72 / UBC 951) TaxID=1037660 RepID=A0A066WGP3_TILAU|nr:uncharacterized protein K437DRAFT_253611 [Tilletiaria anomala UBC 951]KDN52966.1 hypothetical protein K437DRAFT_253611 [Tilletiaria anomala UBC 951]
MSGPLTASGGSASAAPPLLAAPKPKRAVGLFHDAIDGDNQAHQVEKQDGEHGRARSITGFEFRTSLHSPSPPPVSIERRSSPFRPSSTCSPPPSQLVYNVPPLPRTSQSPVLNGSPKMGSPKMSGTSMVPAPPRSPTPVDLKGFAATCHGFYFEQDEASKLAMESMLNKAPPTHRPTYMRLQAKVRQDFHAQVARQGRERLERDIENAIPASKLPDHGERPRSAADRRARYGVLQEFIRSHCTSVQVGTRPFFGALRLFMQCQARGRDRGGAGCYQAIWAFDEAVLLEAAGPEFERDAVNLLVRVLGFEVITPARRRTCQRQPTADNDPFGEAQGSQEHRSSLHLSNSPVRGRPSFSNSPHKSSPLAAQTESESQACEPPPVGFLEPPEDEPFYRLWKIPPYYTDPELRALSNLIPEDVLPARYRDVFSEAAQQARKTLTQGINEAVEAGRSPFELMAVHANLGRELSARPIMSILPPDEGSVGMIQLPTGWVWRSDDLRDSDHKGGLVSRVIAFFKRTLLRKG